MNERFVVLGASPVRREWFSKVGRWANDATLPMEFIKCISVGEVYSRLESGRPFSAVLLDASTVGLDRNVLDLAASVGCSPIIVDHGLVNRDWAELGAKAVIPENFDAALLRDVLEENALPISRATAAPTELVSDDTGADLTTGRVVAVTGAGGMGTSTIAMALAQGLARYASRRQVLLADMALRSGQAMLHDSRDVIPGLLEFVDSHRLGVPNPEESDAAVHTFPERGYDLLLGLRHERDWVSIAARSLSASWTTMLSRYSTTVCDITGDFDGADQTGSNDIEDRNRLSRMAARQADIIAVVGSPGAWGVHHLVRTILSLHDMGVTCDRVLPVINHAPRQPRARAGLAATLADLTGSRISDADLLPSPIFLPTRRNLELTLRDGQALPKALTEPLASAINALLDLAPVTEPATEEILEPVPVAPGSLGTWEIEDD